MFLTIYLAGSSVIEKQTLLYVDFVYIT